MTFFSPQKQKCINLHIKQPLLSRLEQDKYIQTEHVAARLSDIHTSKSAAMHNLASVKSPLNKQGHYGRSSPNEEFDIAKELRLESQMQLSSDGIWNHPALISGPRFEFITLQCNHFAWPCRMVSVLSHVFTGLGSVTASLLIATSFSCSPAPSPNCVHGSKSDTSWFSVHHLGLCFNRFSHTHAHTFPRVSSCAFFLLRVVCLSWWR